MSEFIDDHEPSSTGKWRWLVIALLGGLMAAVYFSARKPETLFDKGLSVRLVIHSSSEEYAGPAHGDLDLTKELTDIERVVNIGQKITFFRQQAESQLPNPEAGEADRCRINFGEDGQVLLACYERAAAGDSQWLEVRAAYELEIVEGSREDYDAGRQIRLAYTPEGLERRRRALEETLAKQLTPLLRGAVVKDIKSREFADQLVVRCVVKTLSPSSLRATPTSIVIEDDRPTEALITGTLTDR